MGVGFLHGVLPQGLSKSYIISPERVQVLTTDEALFPEDLRFQLEQELNVRFSVTITRDWDVILANAVADSSADLIFLPSYWAQTLQKQNLLSNVSGSKNILLQRVASDFVSSKTPDDFFFLPFYWTKIRIQTPAEENFMQFLKNPKESFLFLLADEDLLLRHFQIWKSQGLLELVAQKKILTLQLDQLSKNSDEGAVESPINKEVKDESTPLLSSLLVWGAIVPNNATKKELSLKVLESLSLKNNQEKTLLKTPFNSAFSDVLSNDIPLYRRATFIRDLQLKDTILIDFKDQEAKYKLKSEFNFIL